MTRQFRVLSSGPHATVQDFGRVGHQALGVPEGGALDRDAMRLGNALVGNAEDAAVVEVCLGGLTIELRAPARVALTGSLSGVLSVQDATGLGPSLEVPANRSVDLDAGRIVRLGMLPDSNTATLAISGGIKVPLLYGSMATSPNAMIGGVAGRVLRDGDILALGEDNASNAPEWAADAASVFAPSDAVRVVMGPQDFRFTKDAITRFTSSPFKVSPVLNRMGMRLDGGTLTHIDNADILSDGIVTGSVQVPGNGQPIILLADHQTTGGYTKIATVITADLPKLARLRPGMAVSFDPISVEEAEACAHAHEAEVQRMLASIKPAAPLMDTAALYRLGDTT
ncbi:MAG: biotin-dependent carboxyltransferase family protein [Alphaproteobacteria bacterium]|nr:biotin-dependent carboxyltransferase family protein [Alphaproteobacteria bacterium]